MAAQSRVNSLAVLGVPVAVFAALTAWLGAPQVLPAALGAAGWMIALALRQPVALIATRLTTKERAMTIVGLASGPAGGLDRDDRRQFARGQHVVSWILGSQAG